MGLRGSASDGKVSGYQELLRGERWLQTTAAINPGSSGGPLLSVDGMLVGVTTISIRDSQNINFAIPVSRVRSFLTTAQLRPRSVAEGASIKWQEALAVIDLQIAMKSARYGLPELNALTALDKAQKELEAARTAESDGAHFNQAINLVLDAKESLPNEFSFFAHYIAGRAHHGLWLTEVFTDWRIADESLEETHVRLASRPHAKSALRSFSRSIELNPDFSPGWLYMARHLSDLGKRNDALAASEVLIKLAPRCAEALGQRAECYVRLNKPELARSNLKAAVELSPLNAELRYELAIVSADLKEFTEAVASYEAALELGLNMPASSLHFNMGIRFQKAANYELAITEFTKAKTAGCPAVFCDVQIDECRQQQFRTK